MSAYVYSGIIRFDKEDDFYEVALPDFDNEIIAGMSYEDAIHEAEWYLGLICCAAEDTGKPLPQPTPVSKLSVMRKRRTHIRQFAVDTDVFAFFHDSVEMMKMRYHDHTKQILEEIASKKSGK